MTIRNLDALFRPRTIALVGAGNQPGSVGAVVARNLFAAGFSGPIMPVNPHERAIRSSICYSSVAQLPLDPDLAVVASPAPAVPGLLAELAARGCRAAVVLTAGLGASTAREAMLDAARPSTMRLVGPNSIGFISPGLGINASFAHLTPPQGDIAFVSQSGAIVTAMLDWAADRRIGFSHVVSVGDMLDVDFGDLLDQLAVDAHTKAILLYVESITNARKFMSAARLAARTKPVVVIKAGRSEAGARAATSHTGALAGSDAVYDAAFRRAGMLRVGSLRELFEAVGTLATGLRPAGSRLAILSNGGGVGVLATDALADYGGEPAVLQPETLEILARVIPGGSIGTPVDLGGDADGSRYGAALDAVLADPGKDAVLVLNCPTAVADGLDCAEATLARLQRDRRSAALTCWLGAEGARASRRLFSASGFPTYETPDEAIRAFMHLVDYRRNQTLLMETPPAVDVEGVDKAAARAIIDAVLADGRSFLSAPEATALLAAYAVPVVPIDVASTPDEAAAVAGRLGGPVALKILSPDLPPRSDPVGVRLDLVGETAVREAGETLLAGLAAARPGARIDGFTVQPMIQRPQAHELTLGATEDATFGPVLLFGQGGTAVEVVADRAFGLPPLNLVLARAMIDRTRVARLLGGYRDRPAADREAIATTLVKLSQMLADLPEIFELDINPLLADADGVLALDARVEVKARTERTRIPFAIRAYPTMLERTLSTRDGARYFCRPIRPEDEPALIGMLQSSDPDDIRLRFFAPIKTIGHGFAARLTQIDYDREMALVLQPAEGRTGAILGVARLISDPDGVAAEFGVMVRSDQKGRGLGYALMQEILDYARHRGIHRVYGDVLAENRSMLEMARQLGFALRRDPHDPRLERIEIELSAVGALPSVASEPRS